MPKSPSLIGIVLIAVLLTLSACTRVVTVRVPATDLSSGSAAIIEAEAADAWWSIAFRMRWDPEQTPDWYLDALLADQVCAPALAEFDPPISLWRFHRRAADDEAGHRFSLLVYTDPLTAELYVIGKQIQTDYYGIIDVIKKDFNFTKDIFSGLQHASFKWFYRWKHRCRKGKWNDTQYR